jgi:hypothetical protein
MAGSEFVVATGNSVATSRSRRNSEGKGRDFTMQPLAKSRGRTSNTLNRPPVVSGPACPFSERRSIELCITPGGCPNADQFELGPRPSVCGGRGADLAPFGPAQGSSATAGQLRSLRAWTRPDWSCQKVQFTAFFSGKRAASVTRMTRERQNCGHSRLRSLMGKTPPVR